ncbi:MAG: GNAT family N-acetyltransferase [Spirochaetaceae bacterium]
MVGIEIITLDSTNVEKHGCYCLKNKKLPGYKNKLVWLKERFDEGLKVKILYSKDEGHIGFIEYISGDFSWRGFSDPNYLFIHCIYIAKKNHRNKDYGKLLLDECLRDAEIGDKIGIAVISSNTAMLAESNVFLKNGFTVIDKHPPKYELLVKQLTNGKLPKFENNKSLKIYEKGLHLIYADQCPYLEKSVDTIDKIAKEKKINLNIIKIKSWKDAQNAPSLYGVFNLILDGELIAEHYISEKRFLNIMDKNSNTM